MELFIMAGNGDGDDCPPVMEFFVIDGRWWRIGSILKTRWASGSRSPSRVVGELRRHRLGTGSRHAIVVRKLPVEISGSSGMQSTRSEELGLLIGDGRRDGSCQLLWRCLVVGVLNEDEKIGCVGLFEEGKEDKRGEMRGPPHHGTVAVPKNKNDFFCCAHFWKGSGGTLFQEDIS